MKISFPGEGNGNPLQYSSLENPMDRGAWLATGYDVGLDWATEHARGKAQWVSGYVMFFKRYIKIISLFGLWYSLQLYHLVFNGISPPLFMWQTLAGHLLYSRHRRTKTLSLGARVWVERRQRSSGAERGSLWLSQNGQGILTEKVTWSRDREEQREGAT